MQWEKTKNRRLRTNYALFFLLKIVSLFIKCLLMPDRTRNTEKKTYKKQKLLASRILFTTTDSRSSSLYPEKVVLTPISFRCSRVVGSGKDFVAIWVPGGLSSGLSPLCDHYLERDWHLISLRADSLCLTLFQFCFVARIIQYVCE